MAYVAFKESTCDSPSQAYFFESEDSMWEIHFSNMTAEEISDWKIVSTEESYEATEFVIKCWGK